jgi:hypothetical protein
MTDNFRYDPMNDPRLNDEQKNLMSYLSVEPCVDYWYFDAASMQWVVCPANAGSYTMPARSCDL